MKSTGIIRRIDELGRIVIPKELRRSLRISDGENLEIFLDGENIILKRFSSMKNVSDFASQLTDVVYSYLKKNIIITDTSVIISASGSLKKSIINQNISSELISHIKRRDKMIEKHLKILNITDDINIKTKYVINSIISRGDVIGLVIILAEEITEQDYNIGNIIADFLGKYIEG